MIPRIRGQIGQLERAGKLTDKFCFQISIWTFDGETQVGDWLGPYGEFNTEAEAMAALKDACRLCCDEAEKKLDGKTSGRYMDMKSGGVMRSWEEN